MHAFSHAHARCRILRSIESNRIDESTNRRIDESTSIGVDRCRSNRSTRCRSNRRRVDVRDCAMSIEVRRSRNDDPSALVDPGAGLMLFSMTRLHLSISLAGLMLFSSCVSLSFVHVVIIHSVDFDPSAFATPEHACSLCSARLHLTSRCGPVYTLTRLHSTLRGEPVHRGSRSTGERTNKPK